MEEIVAVRWTTCAGGTSGTSNGDPIEELMRTMIMKM